MRHCYGKRLLTNPRKLSFDQLSNELGATVEVIDWGTETETETALWDTLPVTDVASASALGGEDHGSEFDFLV